MNEMDREKIMTFNYGQGQILGGGVGRWAFFNFYSLSTERS